MTTNEHTSGIENTVEGSRRVGFELLTARENITGGVDWKIKDRRHAVIVHLGGKMSALETELDGVGMSFSPATAGEIWIVPAGSRYASRADGGTVDYGVVYLSTDGLDQLLRRAPSFDSIQPLHGIRDEFCYNAVRRLIDLQANDDDVTEIMAESIKNALSLHMYQRYGQGDIDSGSIKPTTMDADRIEQLREYIHERLDEKLSVNGLAERVGMRSSQFLTAFRKAFGRTPAQYIIAQRLRRVQWLLVNSNYDITQIALETGFSSHSHLTTVFRKHIGQPPSTFRSIWRDE